jgi:hypothetical protein
MLFGVQSWLIHNLNDISNQAAITLIRKRSSFAQRSYAGIGNLYAAAAAAKVLAK